MKKKSVKIGYKFGFSSIEIYSNRSNTNYNYEDPFNRVILKVISENTI